MRRDYVILYFQTNSKFQPFLRTDWFLLLSFQFYQPLSVLFLLQNTLYLADTLTNVGIVIKLIKLLIN